MRTVFFHAKEGANHVQTIELGIAAAGTKTGKLFTTNQAGVTAEVAGAVSVTGVTATITLLSSFINPTNLPASYDLQVSIDAGPFVSEAAGKIGLEKALTTSPTEISNEIGGAITVASTQVPATSGGLSRRRLIAAVGTNSTVVKATAGQIFTIHGFNAAAAARYLKLYNIATAPVVGTTVPVETYVLPAGANIRIDFTDIGNSFGTGIGLALTAGLADTDVTALAVNDVVLNIHFA